MRLVGLLVLVGCGSGERTGAGDAGVARPTLAVAAGESEAPTIDRVDELRWVVDDSLVARIGAELAAGELAAELEGGRARLTMVPSVDWFGGLDLQVGDEIESVNGVALAGAASLRAVVAAIYRQREVKLALRRAGTTFPRRYVLASRFLIDSRSRLPSAAPATPAEEKLIAAAKSAVRRTGEGAFDIDALLVKNLDATGLPPLAGVSSYGSQVVSPVVLALGLSPYDRVTSVNADTVATPTDLGLRIQDSIDGFALVVNRLDEPVIIRYRIAEGLGDQAALTEALAAIEAERAAMAAGLAYEESDIHAAMDAGIVRDGKTIKVKREVIDKVLANPTSVARGARVVPSVKNGKPNGFKLYAIRPSSLYARLGFENGDTLHSVAGMPLDSAENALNVYTRVRHLKKKSLEVEISRRGKPMTLTFKFVD
jgi:hypothetical protein